MTQTLYLEDFTVGHIHKTDASETLSADDIKSFAAQYDPQPFHLDETAAARSFFGGLAASGWHTAALTMRLLVKTLPISGGIIGAGFEEFRWPRPTRPGDRLRVEVEVLELKFSQSKPQQGFLKHRVTTFNQDNQPVLVMTGNLLVPRRLAGG
ncbi:MaoC family dehydratase [Herbaspirillum autotrophicum]|uniref:MaoC family dehydratase n=1 Tax=Herbaspirillum autotrophicum TaxID=180195 RepID=UPI00067DFE9B|nr:MaoC family dehydratase [Herbaspirillum autotrophicum]